MRKQSVADKSLMNVTLVLITVEIEKPYFIHVQEIKLIDIRDEQDAAF